MFLVGISSAFSSYRARKRLRANYPTNYLDEHDHAKDFKCIQKKDIKIISEAFEFLGLRCWLNDSSADSRSIGK